MTGLNEMKTKIIGAGVLILGIIFLVPFAILGLIPFTLFITGFGLMIGGGSAIFLKDQYE